MNEPDGRLPAAVALVIALLGASLAYLWSMHAAATGRGVW